MTATSSVGLPVRRAGRPRCFTVLPAHGGAGVSTTVGLLQLAFVQAYVVELEPGAPLPESAEPVVVARGSASGLGAAARLIASWRYGDVRPWLVVLADAPATAPGAVRYRLKVLSGQVRGVIAVPFLWPLRSVDDVTDVANARSVQRAVRTLRAALEKG